jgi:hypothetical protein
MARAKFPETRSSEQYPVIGGPTAKSFRATKQVENDLQIKSSNRHFSGRACTSFARSTAQFSLGLYHTDAHCDFNDQL